MLKSKIELINNTRATRSRPWFDDIVVGSFFLLDDTVYIKLDALSAMQLGSVARIPVVGRCEVQLVDVTITYKVAQ